MFFDAAHLRSRGSSPALLSEDGSAVSYAALADLADAFAARLDRGRGLLLIEAENSVACIVAYLGGLQARCPILFATASPPPFACLYRYSPASDTLSVDPDGAGLILHDELALLLSTSGSTGAAKSVRLSHTNLDANATSIAAYLSLTADDRAPTNLPLHYSYGLSILNSHLAAGGAMLLTDRTVLEPEFWTAFTAARCTSIAGVPHSWDLLENSALTAAPPPSLRYATQAGGKLSPERVARWAARSTAAGWQFVVMYGQTEAAPRMAYLAPDLAEAHPDCIGRAIPGGRFRLLDDAGGEITAPDVAGELVYEGPNVMMGYATDVADLARGHEVDRLETGDIAVRTPDDLYRIIGRRSRFIKPFGLRIALEEVEAHLAARGYAAACAGGPQERLWVLVAGAGEAERAALRTDLEGWLKVPASVIEVRGVEAIPRRENGKIDTAAVRDQVAALASEAERDRAPATRDGDPARGVVAAFERKFGGAAADRSASYQSLGGDSLSYIDTMLQLEQHIPALPSEWASLSIDELVALAGEDTHVADAFVATFGDAGREGELSFDALGGDAAQRRALEPRLRSLIPALPDDWPALSIGALSALEEQGARAEGGAAAAAYRPTNLDTVRGLACVLIVALHVLGVRAGQGLDLPRPSTWHAIMDALDLVRLPLFTTLAGYIYGAMPARDGFAAYMGTKLRQLAIPVLFANAVFWVIKDVILRDPGRGFLATYLHGYEHLWYIYALLLIFAVVALIDRIARPAVRGWMVAIGAAAVAYWIAPPTEPTYFKSALLLLPFFLFGIVLQRESAWMTRPLVIVASAVVFVGALAIMPLGNAAALEPDRTGVVTWLGGAGAVILLLRFVPKVRPLEWLAGFSFTIYLWHPAASATMRTLLWRLGISNTALMFVAGLLVGVGVPVAIHLIASRLPKLFSMPVIGK